MLLVTGASGHVGSAALRHLAAAAGPQAVAGLARNAERAARAVPGGVALRIADYEDRHSLDRAFDGVTRLLFVASARRRRRRRPAARRTCWPPPRRPASSTSCSPASSTSTKRRRSTSRRCTATPSGGSSSAARTGRFFAAASQRFPLVELAGAGMCERRHLGAGRTRAHRAGVARRRRRGSPPRCCCRERTGARCTSSPVPPRCPSTTWPSSPRAHGARASWPPCAPAAYLLRLLETMADPWPHAFSTLFASIAQGRYAHTSAAVRQLAGRAPEDLGRFSRGRREAGGSR